MISPEIRPVDRHFRHFDTSFSSNCKKRKSPHRSKHGASVAPCLEMLKISIKDTQTRRVLLLEGKIIAPWTDELSKAACQDKENHRAGRELVVDLRGVTDISADGGEALYCLMVQGARFRGGGVFIQRVLKELAQRAVSQRPS